jgi:hypothetical protein
MINQLEKLKKLDLTEKEVEELGIIIEVFDDYPIKEEGTLDEFKYKNF